VLFVGGRKKWHLSSSHQHLLFHLRQETPTPRFPMAFRIRSRSLSALLISSIILTGQAQAQAQTDQRMKFVEGLFRTIIEARSQRNRQVPGVQAPVNPPTPAPTVQPEIQQYRARIAAYAGETNKLANSMGQAAAQTPALRSYLPEIYAVRSQALLLQQNAAAVNNLAVAEPGFRTLDIAWRDLAYRMKSDRRLNASCRNSNQIPPVKPEV